MKHTFCQNKWTSMCGECQEVIREMALAASRVDKPLDAHQLALDIGKRIEAGPVWAEDIEKMIRAADLRGRVDQPLTGEQCEQALKEFTDYFVQNYPGPDTIIHNPNWHAPKIFRAAERALRGRVAEPPHPGPTDEEKEQVIEAGWAKLDEWLRG